MIVDYLGMGEGGAQSCSSCSIWPKLPLGGEGLYLWDLFQVLKYLALKEISLQCSYMSYDFLKRSYGSFFFSSEGFVFLLFCRCPEMKS